MRNKNKRKRGDDRSVNSAVTLDSLQRQISDLSTALRQGNASSTLTNEVLAVTEPTMVSEDAGSCFGRGNRRRGKPNKCSKESGSTTSSYWS